VSRMLCASLTASSAGVALVGLLTLGSTGFLAQQLPSNAASAQVEIDPELDAAVHRYFETQEKEDVAGYIDMWSSGAQRPSPAMLKFIFDAGDDQYSEVAVLRATQTAGGARVRVGALRVRTATNPQGVTSTSRSRLVMSLVYVKEAGSWKLLREGPAVDDLAAALMEASSADAREQLLDADKDLVAGPLVDALSRRGTDLVRGRQFAGAQAAYERAVDIARRVGDDRREGEALQNLANSFYYQRNFPRALESYEQRLTIERARQDDEGIASALTGVAIIRYSYAEYGVALAAYREALALQEKLANPSAAATTLISTGNVLYLLGDFPASIADYRRSRELYRGLTDTEGEAKALGGLARVYVAQGDLAAALDALGGVLAESRARSSRHAQGAALLSIGEVHLRLGNLSTARSSFEESRGHFEAEKELANVGRVWQDLAFVELLGGAYAAAERGYARSAEACGTADDPECVAAATVGLGFAQTSQDKFVAAVISYRRAIDAFTGANLREQAARARIGLAQALTGLEKYEEAIAAARDARQGSIGLSVPDIFWRALVAEARALGKSDALERALGSARAAIYAVDEMRETARVQPGSPLPRDTATAFATLARLLAQSGDAAAAFDTSERLRVHDMRAALTANEREIVRGMTAAEREEERAAAMAVVALRAQLTRERGLPKPDSTRTSDLEKKIAEAVAKRTEQQDRLFARLPDLRLWRGMFDPAQSGDLSKVLDADTILIDLVVDEDGLVSLAAWLEDGQPKIASQVSPLTRRALAELVMQLLQPATLKDAAAWKKASTPLLAALPPGTMERAAGARRVIVIPHEMLWRVPFEALPLGETYLGAKTTLTYAASLSSLRSSRSRATAPDAEASGQLLAVAAPTLPASVTTHISQTAPDWVIRSADSATRETKLATADRDPSTAVVLDGAAATKSAVREGLARANVIHIAAPFRVNGASVLFSPILLAGAPAQTTDATAASANSVGDAILELREVFNLDLHARLAVLSDGAALSMRDAASELGIVHWGWCAAGVPWLVLPRWPSDDAARETLVRELQRQLRAGKRPDDALLAARQAVRQTPAWRAPFYWSGWIAVGEGSR
jgi:tetratricopeptide (TPR) repeat protein